MIFKNKINAIRKLGYLEIYKECLILNILLILYYDFEDKLSLGAVWSLLSLT